MKSNVRCNLTRRNLSPTQKQGVLKTQKSIATSLRKADPKKWTQKSVAELLGVARTAVDNWFNRDPKRAKDIPNATGGNSHTPPDARVKVNTAAKRVIADRVKAGESQAQIAADYRVTQQNVPASATNHLA